MFKRSVQKRGVLIPAEGFYEGQKLPGGRKQPCEFHLKGERLFFFAGVHETAMESRPETFAFFKTRPNEVTAAVHNRMPAILIGDRAREWLTPGPLSAEAFAAFTEPYPAGDMEALPVSIS